MGCRGTEYHPRVAPRPPVSPRAHENQLRRPTNQPTCRPGGRPADRFNFFADRPSSNDHIGVVGASIAYSGGRLVTGWSLARTLHTPGTKQ